MLYRLWVSTIQIIWKNGKYEKDYPNVFRVETIINSNAYPTDGRKDDCSKVSVRCFQDDIFDVQFNNYR